MAKYIETKLAREAMKKCGFTCWRIYTEKRKNGVRCKIWHPETKHGVRVRSEKDVIEINEFLGQHGYAVKLIAEYYPWDRKKRLSCYNLQIVKI